MSNTPCTSAKKRRKHVETWVNFWWKNPARPGQISVEINKWAPISSGIAFAASARGGDNDEDGDAPPDSSADY
jgi:hypothetical protein